MQSPAPRGGAEGTEERVLALHTKEAREGDCRVGVSCRRLSTR